MAEIKSTLQPLPPMQMLAIGKIEAVRRYEETNYTRIITPAPDMYSKPQFIEIRSKSRIGSKGEEVSVVVRAGGYTRKAYEFKDKSTGEIVKIVPVDHTYDLVE
jgi:DNA transposition AAA+ family ATPase